MFAAGDHTALAGAIARVFDDPAGANAMAQRARALVVDRFSVSAMQDSIMGLYDGLLGGVDA